MVSPRDVIQALLYMKHSADTVQRGVKFVQQAKRTETEYGLPSLQNTPVDVEIEPEQSIICALIKKDNYDGLTGD